MNEPLPKFQLNSSQKNKNNTKATQKQRAPGVANGIQAERVALGYNTWSQITPWNTVTQTVTHKYKTRIEDQWDRRSYRHLISFISCLCYVYVWGIWVWLCADEGSCQRRPLDLEVQTDRSTCFLCRRPGFGFQHPHGMSELPQSNSMGSDNLFWPPKVPNKHTMCIHTCKQTHTKFIMKGTDVCFTYYVSYYVSANILVYVYAIYFPQNNYTHMEK